GAFSESFNKMTKKLEEREQALKRRAEALSESMELLVAVVDGMTEWLVVVEIETGEIIYTNQSANREFYDYNKQEQVCKVDCPLMDALLVYGDKEPSRYWELSCTDGTKVVGIESYYVQWNGKGAYAHLISDITDAKIQEEELEYMVFHDELTGLGNRRYGLEKLEEIMKENREFSLVVVDLDRLKRVNDVFGHLVGDDYIKRVVHVLSSSMRSADMLFRIGGDEFILIFERCGFEQARRRMTLLSEEIKNEKSEYPKSISYGVAYVTKDSNKSFLEILEEADHRMYYFKNSNRKSDFVDLL
ncbi:MAG: diguanylate cyclase, partial [Eubacterium sp.]